MPFSKKNLRKEYLNKRIALSANEKSKLDDLLLIQLQRVALPFAQTVLNYVPIEEKAEPNTYLFAHYLEFIIPKLQLAYPITDMQNGTMQAYAVDDETEFEKRNFGLIEPLSNVLIDPKEIDIVIVPMLVADCQGYRVGYGKGVYDKYLSQCRPDVFKIGFSYFDPIDKILDKHENDLSLSVLISPKEIFYF